jgi:gliding motility-associated-like protein
MKKIGSWALLLFLFLGKVSFGQISLSQTTVNNYVTNICGVGVTFSNVSLTGSPDAIANFTGGISGGLGSAMNSGVVLGTGYLDYPTALAGSGFKSDYVGGVSISQLDAIAGSPTEDGIILEFDFIPITNQIAVNFQFGSEEYNEFVNSGYNDAFAFLISGPGIAGNQNLAVVPSTSTPVTINTINNGYSGGTASGPCDNCAYYIDNYGASYNNPIDGYTTVLTANATVIPCQTYHIRLMIADAGDELYDSWVFIQQGGLFAVGNPPLSMAATYPFGSALYEECLASNTITFTIPVAQAADYTFNVTWTGTATNGVDYGLLPTTITIPAGQTSVNVPVTVFSDGLAEGVETLICNYPATVCSTGTTTFNIDDPTVFTMDAGPDVSLCASVSPTTLTAVPSNPTGSVSYAWDNGAGSSPSVTVSPASTTTYTITGTDQCGRIATDQVTVNVGNPPVIDAGTNTSICPGGSTTLSATGGVSYSWDNGLGAGNGISVSPASTTTYNVTGTASNGCTSTDAITITVNTVPSVNAGTDQTICQGAMISVSGSGAQTYAWNNGVSNGVSFSPASTTTYTVTGTDANGCSNTDQVTITVNVLPNVDAGSPQSVCQGGSVTLNGSGAQGYVWSNGASNGVSFIPSGTQTYTLTGTDANGCVNTDQVTITVNPLPVVDAGSPQTVCQGGSVTLNGAGAQSYTWNNGANNGVSFSPASTTTYTVTGTDLNGCVNTDQVTITVNPLPNVDAGSPQAICQGLTAVLNGSGAQTYVWNNGVTNGSPFTVSSTQTYTVTGTDLNGCVNTDQVTVSINVPIQVNAGIDQTVCQGGSVTLTATGVNSYSWNNNVMNGVVFIPSSTQTYTVTGTDVNGCTTTDQVLVTVNPLPNVSAGADQSICIGGTITLSGSGAQTYVWNNGVSDGIPFNPLSTQTYTVTGTDANGCTNTDQVTVTIVPMPVADVSSDVTSGYIPLTVNFDNNSSNAASYHWAFGNGAEMNASTTAGTQYVYTVPGDYVVVLTAANGACTDTDTLVITVEPVPDPEFKIPNIFTPNGDDTNDTFFITVSYVKSVKVQIVNRWGDKMCNYDDINGYWDGIVNGDMASEGVYFFTYVIEGINGKVISGHGNIQLAR